MRLYKKEKTVLSLIQKVFDEFGPFDEHIFDLDHECYDGHSNYTYNSELKITKDFIYVSICLDTIDLSRFLNIDYDKKTRKIYATKKYMTRRKTSLKRIEAEFKYILEEN